jgi:hypothetical protein
LAALSSTSPAPSNPEVCIYQNLPLCVSSIH